MKAEIITVGTELLIGQTLDTNSQLLSRFLNEWGFDVLFKQCVGDNPDRLSQSIHLALSRSDLVVLCGGLGPTADDLTKEVASQVLGCGLERDEVGAKHIEEHFAQGKRDIPANNWQQADYLKGGTPLENTNGLAVGSFWENNGKMLVLLPGPPRECQAMIKGPLTRVFRQHLTDQSVLYNRYFQLYGLGESKVATILEQVIADQEDPTIALYAKPTEVTIRLSTKAATEEEADKCFEPIAEKIYKDLSPYIYAEGKDVTLEKIVMEELKERGLTLAAAESLTGGLLMSQLTAIPGASSVIKGGIVSYATSIKHQLLGVPQTLIEKDGVVSSACAKTMAESIRQLCSADIGVGLTGVAGPGQQEGKAVGTVFIGLATKNGCQVYSNHFSGDRERIRQEAIHKALFELRHLLQ